MVDFLNYLNVYWYHFYLRWDKLIEDFLGIATTTLTTAVYILCLLLLKSINRIPLPHIHKPNLH